ncbi:MAG: hypothetical protein ACQEVA_20385 [Myxococcota bacterium]
MTDAYGYRGWLVGGEDTESGLREDVELPAERSGVDEIMAVVWTTTFTILMTVSLGMAIFHASDGWALAAAGAWIGALVAATCTRWRLRVTTAGVEFRRWECGIPVDEKRFLLDVEFGLYESWTSWEPEGIEVYDPRDEWTQTTGCFGPHFSKAAQLELIEWLDAALQKARAWSGTRDGAIRCPQLDGKLDGVRPDRWGHSGEVREATATRALVLSGVPVPEGSTILFNDDRPIRDPRRADTLSGVRLAEDSTLPNGLELSSGARLTFIGDGIWVHENGAGRAEHHGVVYDVDDVMFDADWELKRFMLAESIEVDGVEIPVESEVSRMLGFGPGAYLFHIRLAEPVMHDGSIFGRDQVLFFESRRRLSGRHSPMLIDAVFDEKIQIAPS